MTHHPHPFDPRLAHRGTLAPRRQARADSEAALQRILEPPSIATELSMLFRYAGGHDIPLYVLIDEYDKFANTVLVWR